MVVFVCEHGAAKSVVAAAWLQRLAAEAQLDLSAMARGTGPSAELSPMAVAGLIRDGIETEETTPQPLRQEDLADAWRVVGFAPEVTGDAAPDTDIELWTVPAVSDGYESARNAIVARLKALLDDAARTRD